MQQFSEDIQQQLSEIQTEQVWRMVAATDALLAMQSTASQTALRLALHDLQAVPDIYWKVINGLYAQQAIDAVDYYEKTLFEEIDADNYRMKEAALRHVQDIDYAQAIRILSEALLHVTHEELVRMTVSLLAEQSGEMALYRLVMIVRQHPNHFVRRAAVKQMAYRFEPDVLIPLALSLIYSESNDWGEQGSAVNLIWHLVIQQKFGDYTRELITALKYCMVFLPELGVMPYRCLMEMNKPEADAVARQWQAKNVQEERKSDVNVFP
jgi:hypothetical protein